MSDAVAVEALGTTAVGRIPAPHIEYGQLAPTLIVLATAVIGIVVEAFLPRRSRYLAQLGTTVVGLAAAFTAVVGSAVPGSEQEKAAIRAGLTTTEVFPLMLFSVGGMLIFPAADDLLTLFISLEVFSLPLYLLAALARRHRLISQEAVIKYFLLGAFFSAFLLFGIAMLYGYAGTVSYGGIADVVDGMTKGAAPALGGIAGNLTLLRIGVAMPLVVGVLSSAVAAFVYLRVVVMMSFREPQPSAPTVAVPSPLTSTAIAVGLAVTVALGVAPQYFLDLAGHAGIFVQ